MDGGNSGDSGPDDGWCVALSEGLMALGESKLNEPFQSSVESGV